MDYKVGDELINSRILEQNLKRFYYLPFVAVPISIGHILLFYLNLPEPGSIEFTWRWGIIFSHTLLIVLAILIGFLASFKRKRQQPSDEITSWIINLLILMVVLVGVAITLIDQLVTPAITPFLVIITVVAVVFLMPPRYSLIMYLLAYGLFFFLLPLTQHDAEILLSNRVNGLSFIGIGFLISLILWRNNWTGFQQKIIIEKQSEVLEKNNVDLKIQATQLMELNATKDKFFSIIAHDLKSPFNSIMGLSELLVDQIKNNDYVGIEKYARIIKKSSEQAMELLSNLMQWTRAQTGRMEFNPQKVELVALINKSIELSNNAAQHKSIQIIANYPETIEILADKEMISTVLRNLISNAIKFTNDYGKIEIEAKTYQEHIFVSVKDNGVGINQKKLDQLFKMDHTYSTAGTHQEIGSGLGLLLCKEFIDKHGGKIWVESEQSKGSVFSFSFPIHIEFRK